MELIFLTGMSGAGKSTAFDFLEDQGFFCVDNVPPALAESILSALLKGDGGEGVGISKIAFVIDVRSPKFTETFGDVIERIDTPHKLIFLDCAGDVLVSRYNQTRRKHPFGDLPLTEAIEKERGLLQNIRARATHIIDTSMMSPKDLCAALAPIIEDDESTGMTVHVESFGFKFGPPSDCDLVFDARFLPNPYYEPRLKNLTGRDKEICDYLEGFPETLEFIERLKDLLNFLVPLYIKEGKGSLQIGFGCTGGRHRSVYCAESMYKALNEAGFKVVLHHRDIGKDSHRYNG